MPIKEDLLEILCCPETKEGLQLVEPETLRRINERIAAGEVRYQSTQPVREPLEEALITLDGSRIYAIRDSIPVMLVEESIPAAQLGDLIRR